MFSAIPRKLKQIKVNPQSKKFLLIPLFTLALILVAKLSIAETISLEPMQWQVLNYDRIPPHRVTFDNSELTIEVNRSASPIIYPFASPRPIQSIQLIAQINGRLKFNDIPQGALGADDFRLRIGLIYAGGVRPDEFTRQLLPEWVRSLYSITPENIGFSHVNFFNTWQQSRLAGTKRVHPKSKLWHEEFRIPVPSDGGIDFQWQLNTDRPALGLWISSDGDDTQSKFSVVIKRIVLNE